MPVPTVLIPDDEAIARMNANVEQPLTTPMREVRLGRVRPKARPMAARLAGYYLHDRRSHASTARKSGISSIF